MENWTEKVIPTLNLTNTKTLRLMDTVQLLEEENVDGAEEEEETKKNELEWDEHVWTSPSNAIKIVEGIKEEIINIIPDEIENIEENTKKYVNEINEIDSQMWDIVKKAKRNRLVFGDRMPMRYFIEEFNLNASGAFNGCSTETEPSTRTISYLIELVKKEEIPVILYIENGNEKVAKLIARETGTDVMEIQTLHTISREDFENGETYVTLMKKNLSVLKKALQ
jgi:zinc transport system substrate-binding protein